MNNKITLDERQYVLPVNTVTTVLFERGIKQDTISGRVFAFGI